jgi:chromosome segregation ATPase
MVPTGVDPERSARRSAFIKAEDNDAFSSPRKITKNLATTRIENATLRDRLNSHELEVQRRDRIVGQLEQRLAEVDAKLKQAEKELAATKEKARVDSSQTTLLRQEVQMLKRHLVRRHTLLSQPATDSNNTNVQESYTTEEAINHAGNFDTQKTTRIAELEELLEAHRREVATLTDQVSHWRGLVERYGGNTTEIVDLEEREKRERADDAAQTSVKNTLEEQLRLNEELRRGKTLWRVRYMTRRVQLKRSRPYRAGRGEKRARADGAGERGSRESGRAPRGEPRDPRRVQPRNASGARVPRLAGSSRACYPDRHARAPAERERCAFATPR